MNAAWAMCSPSLYVCRLWTSNSSILSGCIRLSRIFYAGEFKGFRGFRLKLLGSRFVVLGRQESNSVDEDENLGEKKVMGGLKGLGKDSEDQALSFDRGRVLIVLTRIHRGQGSAEPR